MKKFKFKSIWLVSEKEQKARKLTFSPKKNLIVGMNHTGKSSLIKSMYAALGARPTGKLSRWSDDVATLVQFSLDGVDHYVLHQHNFRALFDAYGKLQFAAANATDWGIHFADVIGFNLLLTDNYSNPVPADARTFFLPFYINQDGSWQGTWSTFVSLQQYRAPVQATLDYFTGVKPPEYYTLNAQKKAKDSELGELRREEKLINNVKQRFGSVVALDGPKTVPSVFDEELKQLTAEFNILNVEQESLRSILVKEKETVESLAQQIILARHALEHYDRDASFLQSEPHEILVCPTCHAEHHKTFLDILEYAEDARVLRRLVVQLEEDARKAENAFATSKARLSDLESNYARIAAILEVKRGDLRLDDVVRSLGAETAFAAFAAELSDLGAKIDALVVEIDKLTGQSEALTSVARSKEILKIFRDAFSAALFQLNMPPVDTKNMKLASRPSVSGSGGPRSILAYYSALWETCTSEYGSFSVPVVIDSPQQQGQDASNLPIMIKYIAQKLPTDLQVILAVETPTDFAFDKVIQLDTPYQMLQVEVFDETLEDTQPFIDQMYSYLMG